MPTHLQVTRNVPGIDSAHLAMDTEEGVEVVWNEVCYSNRKLMKGTKVEWPWLTLCCHSFNPAFRKD